MSRLKRFRAGIFQPFFFVMFGILLVHRDQRHEHRACVIFSKSPTSVALWLAWCPTL